jgi:hypothetical protein
VQPFSARLRRFRRSAFVILRLHSDPLVLDLSLLFSSEELRTGQDAICAWRSGKNRNGLSQLHPISPAHLITSLAPILLSKNKMQRCFSQHLFSLAHARSPNSLVPAEKELNYASTMIGHPGRYGEIHVLVYVIDVAYQTTYRE